MLTPDVQDPTGTTAEEYLPHQEDEHGHFVQFYDTDAFLVESVARFMAAGLQGDDACIIVAAPEHLAAFHEALLHAGCDLNAAETSGRYVTLDARETLSRFMVEGAPDQQLFADTIGPIIEAAASGSRGVRIFGEMVALLWKENEVAAAIELEELWNRLTQTQDFSLFCAYPMAGFDHADSDEPFQRVCAAHTKVIPSETFSQAPSGGQRLRAVATLQQKARSAEHEAQTLRAQREELQGMLQRFHEIERARKDSLAMVVHDLRTPNAITTGFLEMLRSNWTSLSPEQVTEFLTLALSNTKQMSKLLNDMLATAEIESGHFTYELKALDLAELIYRAVAGVRQTAPDVTFDVTVPRGLPKAFADESRQLQILNNLLTNAVSFTSPRGSVMIDVELRGQNLIVSVRDQGPGIAPSDHPKLFQRFSRLQPPRYRAVKGTGLGLYISKALVEGQGGRIWIDSELGRGSTFSYTVPVETSGPSSGSQ